MPAYVVARGWTLTLSSVDDAGGGALRDGMLDLEQIDNNQPK
jgi:hypothetical protein